MNDVRRLLKLSLLGSCAFVLTGALLPMFLTAGDTPVEGNPVWKIILAVLYLGVALILAADFRGSLFAVQRNGFLLALVLLAIVSCVWAENSALVLQRSIALTGTVLLGIALAVRLSLEEQLRLISWVFRIIAVMSLACAIFMPQWGISHGVNAGAWRGIFQQKNLLGEYMALAILVEWYLPTETRMQKLFSLSAMLLSAFLLLHSHSITSVVTLAAALLFGQAYKLLRLRAHVPRIAIFLFSLMVVAIGAVVLFLTGDAIPAALGRSSDLTGRTEIWAWVFSRVLQRPILGYGYSGFWGGASSESLDFNRQYGLTMFHSHNGYLDLTLTLGVVGLVFLLGFLWTGIKRTVDYAERNESKADLWPLALLIFILVHNMAEVTIMWPNNLEWALGIAAVVIADPRLSTAEAQEQDEFLLVPSGEFS
jgi:exopolysaccharide production protein ExoQ